MAENNELYCKKCHQSFTRLACLALLIDLGCSSSRDPSECPEGDEHEFVKLAELQSQESEG